MRARVRSERECEGVSACTFKLSTLVDLFAHEAAASAAVPRLTFARVGPRGVRANGVRGTLVTAFLALVDLLAAVGAAVATRACAEEGPNGVGARAVVLARGHRRLALVGFFADREFAQEILAAVETSCQQTLVSE